MGSNHDTRTPTFFTVDELKRLLPTSLKNALSVGTPSYTGTPTNILPMLPNDSFVEGTGLFGIEYEFDAEEMKTAGYSRKAAFSMAPMLNELAFRIEATLPMPITQKDVSKYALWRQLKAAALALSTRRLIQYPAKVNSTGSKTSNVLVYHVIGNRTKAESREFTSYAPIGKSLNKKTGATTYSASTPGVKNWSQYQFGTEPGPQHGVIIRGEPYGCAPLIMNADGSSMYDTSTTGSYYDADIDLDISVVPGPAEFIGRHCSVIRLNKKMPMLDMNMNGYGIGACIGSGNLQRTINNPWLSQRHALDVPKPKIEGGPWLRTKDKGERLGHNHAFTGPNRLYKRRDARTAYLENIGLDLWAGSVPLEVGSRQYTNNVPNPINSSFKMGPVVQEIDDNFQVEAATGKTKLVGFPGQGEFAAVSRFEPRTTWSKVYLKYDF